MPAIDLIDVLIAQTDASFSDITRNFENAVWVRSQAREVNIDEEYETVRKLSEIMTEFRQRFNWGAVSSNNIYWNLTEEPISVIQIPDPAFYQYPFNTLQYDKSLTIVNPKIIEVGEDYVSGGAEGCGSLGEVRIPLARHKSVTVEGYILEEGVTRQVTTTDPVLTSYIEHEVEHLDGIIIGDYGPVFYMADTNNHMGLPETNPMNQMSDSFNYVWPTKRSTHNNSYVFSSHFNRHLLIDEDQIPIPTLSFVLEHDRRNQPYWSVHKDKMWAKLRDEPDFEYGKPIIFEFPDTPEFREVLRDMPDMKSNYDFFSIPIVFA